MARQWLIDSFGTLGVLGLPGFALALLGGVLLLAMRHASPAASLPLSFRQTGPADRPL